MFRLEAVGEAGEAGRQESVETRCRNTDCYRARILLMYGRLSSALLGNSLEKF